MKRKLLAYLLSFCMLMQPAEGIVYAAQASDLSVLEETEDVLMSDEAETVETENNETTQTAEKDEIIEAETIDETKAEIEKETIEIETQTKATEEAVEAEEVKETKAAKIKISDNLDIEGFKRELGENDKILFTRQYVKNWFKGVQTTVNDNISISVDGETLTGLNEALMYTWEIKTGESYAAIENDGVPNDAAEYRLHIVLDKVEGLCEAADAYVYFTVEKKQLKPKFTALLSVNPSDTVGEFKERLLAGYTFDDPDADKTNIVNSLTIFVYEVSSENGAKSEQPLSDETKFYYNKNYIMTVDTLGLTTDAGKNYEVILEEYYAITVSNLIKTQVIVELDAPGKEISKTYDGNPADISLLGIKKDNNVELVTVYKVIDEKTVEIEGAKAEPAWYVCSNPAEDNGDELEYTRLEQEPVDAGEYYVMYEYTPEGDDVNLYAGSKSAPIKVTINQAPLYIVPKEIEVYEGMTAEELTKALAETDFDLFVTVNDSYKGNVFDYSADHPKEEFFGVSYSGDGNKERLQYYYPEFELQIREKTAEKEGDEVKFDDTDKWMNVSPNYLPLKATTSNKGEKREYRLKFTGNKILYDNTGKPIEESRADISDTSTNSADKNHVVVYDEPLAVTVAVRSETEINKDEIIRVFTEKNPENKGDGTLENPAYKVYDKNSLFNESSTRADYKHAVLYENGVATDIRDTNEGFTYTWYYTTIDKYEEYISEDEDGKKQFVNEDKWDWTEITNDKSDNTNPNDGTLVRPTDSGFYKLNIKYKDSENNRLSAQKDVYFFIKQQEIIVAVEDRYVSDGDKWSDADTIQPPLIYTVYEVPDNDIDKFNNMYESETERADLKVFAEFDEDNTFQFIWNVRRQKLDVNGNDDVDADKQPLYEKIWKSKDSEITLYKNRKYQIYAYIEGLEDDEQYKNYTCEIRPVNHNETDDEVKYRFLAGNILFTESELDIVINQDKIPAAREYNGEPIAQSLADLNGLITIKDKSGADVTSDLLNTDAEYNKELVNVRWYWVPDKDDDEHKSTVITQDAVYGGTYYLCVDFAGNAQYAAYSYNAYNDYSADNKNAYSFRITKKEITVRPVLIQDGIKAGIHVSRLYGFNPEDNSDKRPAVRVEGLADRDSEIFTYQKYQGKYLDENGNQKDYEVMGYPAFYQLEDKDKILDAVPNYDFTITTAENSERIENPEQIYLKYDRTYDIKYTGELVYPYKTSYDVIYQAESTKIDKRGTADVQGAVFFADAKGTDAPDVRYEYDAAQAAYTIVPREGIRFYYERKGEKDSDKNDIPFTDGNYIALEIFAPKELEGDINGNSFDASKIIYKNSVKEAGGYILDDWQKVNENGKFIGHAIKVLFPVTEDESGNPAGIKSFAITWESADTTTAYVECFKLDLTDAALEADLKKAVAPKSLAFNGVNTKMAVGETQQLDVKVTKAQLADIICLNYRLSGGGTKNEYLSIDAETGVVTALKECKSAVEVEVYPVYRAPDGTIQEITGKGVKTAKTKITVNAVSAPAIKNIVVGDLLADIWYTPVNDGYRRELYIVKVGDKSAIKSWNKEKFETEIANMENGQWKGIFAVAPVFWSNEQVDDTVKKLSLKEIEGLEPNSQYVLYLRNVSSVRTLDDGSKVAFSGNGSVKSFVTLKSQVKRLEPYFIVNENNTADKKNTVVRNEDGAYTVELVNKTAQLNVYGLFEEKENGNTAADENDLIKYNLPLSKNNKDMLAYYMEPKLTYRIYASDDNGEMTDIQSKYAVISNSGKITLKGVDLDGTVKVWIWVGVNNLVGEDKENPVIGTCPLYITAKPDSVAGRKVKLKVGDTMALSDALEYKEGKTKVPYHRSSGIEILTKTEDIENAGYKLIIDNDNQAYITVEKPNASPFALALKDNKLGADGMTATITLTSAQLDPVKGLKVAYVDNQRITLNFTYQGNAEAFALEVKDARGNVVSKTLISNDIDPDDALRWVGILEPTYRQRQQQWILNDEDDDGNPVLHSNTLAYFENTKTYSYTIEDKRLVRKSAYTISLTPVYGANKAAKPAAAKAKTTDLPAAKDWNMDAVQIENGGINVSYQANKLSEKPYFTSGNTYTLDSGIANDGAKNRGTDTLIWKSSNSKVASIKAVPGTYTATLKAMQQGTTTIEVTSKITKKVIARYAVRVKAVGKGAPGFGGDYEPSWDSGFYKDVLAKWDPLYQGRLETLTLENDVIVDNPNNSDWDGTWVSFTAPAFGKYTFTCRRGKLVKIYDGRKLDDVANTANTSLSKYLEQGQRIYLKLTGNFTLSVEATPFAKLTADNGRENPLTIKADEWISFTAPTDNYYVFDGVNITSYKVSESNKAVSDTNSTTQAGGSLSIVLKEGTTLFMQVKPKDATESSAALWVDYAKESLKDSNKKEETEISLSKDNDTSYMKFYAKEARKYKFVYENVTGVTVSYLVIKDETNGQTNLMKTVSSATEQELTLAKGDTVILQFKANSGAFTASTAAVKVKAYVEFDEPLTIAVGKDASVPAESTKLIGFEVPDNGRFIFKVHRDSASITKLLSDDLQTLQTVGQNKIVITVNDDTSKIKKGDKIYLEVKNNTKETTGDAGAARVTIAQVPVESLMLGRDNAKPLVINNYCNEYWYLFTAEKTGYYEFDASYKDEGSENDAEDTTSKHSITSANIYDKLFGTSNGSFGITLSKTGKTSARYYMNAGETVIFRLNASEISGVDNIDKETEAVIKVTDIAICALAADTAATSVSLAQENEEAYYSFTAKEDDTYTFTYTPGKDSGSAQVMLKKDHPNNSSSLANTNVTQDLFQKTYSLSAGDTVYIMVKSTDSETAVSGSLKVTSVKASEITLKSAEKTEFSLEPYPNGAKYYKFTAPEDSEVSLYSVTINVQSDKDGNIPNLNVTIKGNEIDDSYNALYYPYEMLEMGKGDTIRIILSHDEDTNVTGDITIEPIKPELIDSEKNPIVTYAKPVWYKYCVPEDGRYHFPIEESANNKNLTATYMITGDTHASDGGIYDPNGRYLQKGDMVYLLLSSGSDSEEHATVKVPEKITPKSLKIEEKNLITVKASEQYGYYEYTVPETGAGYYNFVSNDLSSVDCFIYDAYQKKDGRLREGYITYVRAGMSLFFRVTADGEDAEGTITVTKANAALLKDGEASVPQTVQSGSGAYFAYTIYEPGLYAFKTVDVETEASGSLEGSFAVQNENVKNILEKPSLDNGFYYLRQYSSEAVKEDQLNELLIVENNTGEDVKFKVCAEKIVPQELTADTADGLTMEELKKNEYQFFCFKAPQKARYRISTDNKDVDIKLIDKEYKPDILLEKGEEVIIYITYAGEKAAASNVNVSVETVTAEAASGTQHVFKVSAHDVKWLEYTFTSSSLHSFTLKKGKAGEYDTLYIYNRILESSAASSSKVYTTFAKSSEDSDKLLIRIDNASDEDVDYVLDVETKSAMTISELAAETTVAFTVYGQTELLSYTADTAGQYQITASVADGTNKGDFYVEYYNEKGISQRKINVYNTSESPMKTDALAAGETIYIKVYPYYQGSKSPDEAYQHDIKIKIDKIIQQ